MAAVVCSLSPASSAPSCVILELDRHLIGAIARNGILSFSARTVLGLIGKHHSATQQKLIAKKQTKRILSDLEVKAESITFEKQFSKQIYGGLYVDLIGVQNLFRQYAPRVVDEFDQWLSSFPSQSANASAVEPDSKLNNEADVKMYQGPPLSSSCAGRPRKSLIRSRSNRHLRQGKCAKVLAKRKFEAVVNVASDDPDLAPPTPFKRTRRHLLLLENDVDAQNQATSAANITIIPPSAPSLTLSLGANPPSAVASSPFIPPEILSKYQKLVNESNVLQQDCKSHMKNKSSYNKRVVALQLYSSWMCYGGVSQQQAVSNVAKAVGVSTSSIHEWLSLWRNSGIERLLVKRGRPDSRSD